jgi:hypothetical protein
MPKYSWISLLNERWGDVGSVMMTLRDLDLNNDPASNELRSALKADGLKGLPRFF